MSDQNHVSGGDRLQGLEALRRRDVLDSEPEQAFDDLTRLAADICDVPVALISLIDQDRQWFKSRINLKEADIPADTAFCKHALSSDALLVIPDTAMDEQLRDDPMVTGPTAMRFYAGAPLVTNDGRRVGTLCLIDTRPRSLSDHQRAALERLARQAVSQIELRFALAEMSAAQEQLHEQMQARMALEAAQRLSGRFMRATIDALQDTIAIVDYRGEIIHVNDTWSRFAEQNGGADFIEKCGTGVNYLAVCDKAARRGSIQGAEVATALRRILARTAESFTLEYPCHAPFERRWFIMRITAFGKSTDRHAVITHRNITARHEAKIEIQKLNESLESRVRERTAELQQATDTLRQNEEQLRASESQLRALTSRLQQVREDERTAISREIHDQLGQMLTAIKIDITLLARDFRGSRAPDTGAVNEALASLEHLLDATIESVRGIARQLRPEVLDALGLAAAIEWHAGEFASRSGIACTLDASELQPELNPEQRSALFRITQECLTNVARHADARQVRLALRYDDGTLELSVSDDGRGVDPGELLGTRSLGVVGMRERAAMIGAAFSIAGTPGHGTTVTVSLRDGDAVGRMG